MKVAKLTFLGGQFIEASEADYDDYKGFLRCIACGEPVFLRKAHKRGNIEIPNAFVHHKDIGHLSNCELRVNKLTQQDIIKAQGMARGQRLTSLKISMWKYLKTNLAVNLKNWSKGVSLAKQYQMIDDVVRYGEEIIITNKSFIIEDTLPRISSLIISESPLIETSPQMKEKIQSFLKERQRDWRLHELITKEALELFIDSKTMRENRYRLCCCLCNPETLKVFPELLDLDMATSEWRSKFVSYLTLEITFVFLTVDWLKILN